jgi:uncharacterized membrane protein required for colicin V production
MIIDIGLVLFAGAGFWLGYTKGLVRTLFFVVFYTIALLLTLALSPWMMDLIIRWFNADKMFALIFGTIFTMVILVVLLHWMLKSVEKYLKKSRFGAYSKSFGGVVMMLVAMTVYSFLIWAIVGFGWMNITVKNKSYAYPVLEQVPIKTKSFIEEFKPLFSRYWDLMEKTVHEGDSPPANQ